MKVKTHRIVLHAIAMAIVSAAIFFSSCDKENSSGPPSLVLLGTEGSITHDTSAAMGDTLHFHLRAKMGGDKLLTFQVHINGLIFKDSTYSSEGFELHLNLIKGADSLEEIRFLVRDRDSHEASVTVKVTLEGGVSWGPVVRYSDIELGAQHHATAGGFYSIADSTVMTLADAFQHQQVIDLLYYHEAGDENTIAAPGSNLTASIFTGPYALANWTTLRTTRFKKVTPTAQEFQQCVHDSLLVASYGTGDGNRKAKNLAAGQYYSFMTEDNRAGIFYVKSVAGTDAGTIVIDLIAQKK